MYYNNILETIGNTPLVKLNRVVADIDATILAKLETFNPGNSIKDRMAVKMIEDAEAAGLLKPGGTIIEGTSGNTGMGLAMVHRVVCDHGGSLRFRNHPGGGTEVELRLPKAEPAEIESNLGHLSGADSGAG